MTCRSTDLSSDICSLSSAPHPPLTLPPLKQGEKHTWRCRIYRMVLAILLPFLPISVQAEGPLPGPIPVEDPVVIDGDSFKGWAVLLPGQRQEITVRIRGIDAPELRGACASERAAALAAKAALSGFLQGRPIFLTEVSADKYYGRVVARAQDAEGGDVAAALLAAGHARPYDGGRRAQWCDPEDRRQRPGPVKWPSLRGAEGPAAISCRKGRNLRSQKRRDSQHGVK